MSDDHVTLKGLEDELRAVGTAVVTYPPAGQPTMVIDGAPIANADYSAELQSYAELIDEAEKAQQHADALRIKRDAMLPRAKARLKSGKAALRGMLGAGNPDLVKYRTKPIKPRRKLTGQENVIKATKAASTRKSGGKKAKNAATPATPPKTP